jgi:hypothetical protein
VTIHRGPPAREEAIHFDSFPKAADDLLDVTARTGPGDGLKKHPLLRGRERIYALSDTFHRLRCP